MQRRTVKYCAPLTKEGAAAAPPAGMLCHASRAGLSEPLGARRRIDVANQKIEAMKTESLVRILAGTFVLLSLTLYYFVNPWWLALAGFVGVNLIQSAFTGFCPAEIIIRKCRGSDVSENTAPAARCS